MTEEKRFIVQQVELSDGMNFEDAEIWEVVVDIDTDGMFFVGDIDTANELCELLNKQDKEIKYWKENAMTLLLLVRRLLPRMNDKEIAEYSKELEKIQDER